MFIAAAELALRPCKRHMRIMTSCRGIFLLDNFGPSQERCGSKRFCIDTGKRKQKVSFASTCLTVLNTITMPLTDCNMDSRHQRRQ